MEIQECCSAEYYFRNAHWVIVDDEYNTTIFDRRKDAILFVAVPDLLAVCESVREAISAGAEPWMLSELDAQAQAAIAKAEPEEG